jgi:fumarylpyruvate hydrolase
MSNAEKFVVDLGERPSLPVSGGEGRYPVRRIYCIGRNYVAHVEEMGGDPKLDFPSSSRSLPTASSRTAQSFPIRR